MKLLIIIMNIFVVSNVISQITIDTTYYDSIGFRRIYVISEVRLLNNAKEKAYLSEYDFRFQQLRNYSGYIDSSKNFVRNGPCIYLNLQGDKGYVDTVLSGYYMSNLKHNNWISYYRSNTGKLTIGGIYYYNFGIKDSIWVDYYPNGKVYRSINWTLNKNELSEYLDSIINDREYGLCTYYFYNGRIRNRGIVRPGWKGRNSCLDVLFSEIGISLKCINSYYYTSERLFMPVGWWKFYKLNTLLFGRAYFKEINSNDHTLWYPNNIETSFRDKACKYYNRILSTN